MTLSPRELYTFAMKAFNTDYPTFEKNFIAVGGTDEMAWHLWKKWKETHNDDILGEYVNMDTKNQRLFVKAISRTKI